MLGFLANKRRSAILLSASLLLVAGVCLRPAFQRWQYRRNLQVAAAFLQTQDFRSATLAARHALDGNPGDPRAIYLLAEISDRTHSPETILWLERLVQSRPGDGSALLALAGAAIKYHEVAIAADALGMLKPKDLESSAGQSLAGTVATLQQEWHEAEEHFAAAARLDGNSPQSRLNLAAIRLRNGKPSDGTSSRAELKELKALPQTRIPALRSLLADARARSDEPDSQAFAQELHDAPDAGPDDRVALLDELSIHSQPGLDSVLSADLAAAEADVPKAATLARWMNSHGLSNRAAEWLDKMPGRLRAQSILRCVRVESAAAGNDWSKVRALTADGNGDWEAIDFLRLVFAARASVELKDGRREPEFGERWERAVHSTSGSPAALSMLASYAERWGWRKEATEIWWQLARRATGTRPALARLWKNAAEARDSGELLRIAKRIAELEPGNVAAMNNLSWLLLLRREELPTAHAIAERNLAMSPDSPGLRTTAALSRSMEGRHGEAISLLAGMPSKELEDPTTSAEAGLVFAGAGRQKEARPLLEAALAHRSELLPEELALVSEALRP